MFFFNKEKQNTSINDINKRDIMTKIEGVKQNCKDPAAIAVLRKLQSELQSQTSTSSTDVVEIDTRLLDILTKIQSSAKREQSAATIVNLIDALELAIDRSEFCQVGGQLSKREEKLRRKAEKAKKNVKKAEASRADQLQDEIDELEAQNEVLQRKYQQLVELNKECPGNASIVSRAASINKIYTGNQTMIQQKKVLLEREVGGSVLENINASAQTDIGRSTYSDTDIEIAAQTNADINTQLGSMAAQNSKIDSILGQGSMGFGSMSATGELAPLGGLGSSELAPLGGLQSSGASAAATQQSAMYGGFDASRIGSREMTQDIKRAIQALEKQMNEYNDKIDDISAEYEACNRELVPLLKKWQDASNAEKRKYEPQIDKLKSQRSTLINNMDRYSGIVAILNDKLALMQRLQAEQDIASSQSRFNELSGGLFSDIEGLAMFVKNSIAMSNEELERMHMATAVAGSESINKNSGSAEYSDFFDATHSQVNADKYADLVAEFGLTC